MGKMDVMDPTGHTEIKWSSNSADETAIARQTFEAMTAKGYQAFRVNNRGGQSERLREFDPDAERMLLIPQLKGG